MPSALSRSMTDRRMYSLAVIRLRAAAVSIAGGREGGHRTRKLSVKRALSSKGLRRASPMVGSIVCVVPGGCPIRERGKTGSDGAAQVRDHIG
jgi:hypothetical protein